MIIQWSTRLFFLGVILLTLFGMGSALKPLLYSAALAYFVFPLIKKLERIGVKRNIALSVVFTFILLFIVFFLLTAIPFLLNQSIAFAQSLPDQLNAAILKLQQFAHDYEIHLNIDKEAIIEWTKSLLPKIPATSKAIIHALTGVVYNVGHSLLILLNIFLFPLFFFYVINDYEKIKMELISLTPPKWLNAIQHTLKKCNIILSGYVRGQFLVAFILAGLYGLGLSLIQVQFGLLIGILTGLLSIIPYVGIISGFIASLIVITATHPTVTMYASVVALFVVLHIIESFFITPKLVGDKVGLSPLVTIMALIIGGNIFGIIGILIAIPIAAIIKWLSIELKKYLF